MIDFPPQYVEIIRELALNYQRKQRELENAAAEMGSEEFLRQVKMLGGLTTDRFRTAQQTLIATLLKDPAGMEKALGAATAICRCFDEMQVLFQILLEGSLTEAMQGDGENETRINASGKAPEPA